VGWATLSVRAVKPKRRDVIALVCGAAVAFSLFAGVGAAESQRTWDSTVFSGRLVSCHDQTSPCADDVEGTVASERGAPAKCTAGRGVEIFQRDTGQLVGTGVTLEDGSFSIPSDDQTYRLNARVLERRFGRRHAKLCKPTEAEVSLFVE
jgi:hypothetical protein